MSKEEYRINNLIEGFEKLNLEQRYRIHKIEVFSIDVEVIIEALKLMETKG